MLKKPTVKRISEVCRYIDMQAPEDVRLDALAARAGLSPFHFQRTFKAVTGISPKQYVEAARLKRLKHGLRECRDVTEAVYEAGFGSSSRVYERANKRLGMTPAQYRRGGEQVSITHAMLDTRFGPMLIAAMDRGLCYVQFGASTEELLKGLRKEFPKAELQEMKNPERPEFQQWVAALRDHLAGKQPALNLPVDVRATTFQMRVWNYLQSIPYGEVRSYAEVASAIGAPKAVRAVGSACGSNRVVLAIPCHRVIRGDGGLGGYRGGLEIKKWLLEQEKIQALQKMHN